MQEILTNQEIDALLDMFETEGAPEEEEFLVEEESVDEGMAWQSGQGLPGGGTASAALRQKRVSRFDLLRPNRFSREQIQYLTKLQEVTALGISSTISEKLRMEGDCDCVMVEQSRFGVFLAGLVSPMALFTLNINPMGQKALLYISAPMLLSAVDKIMGGKGNPGADERSLTQVEFAITDGLISSFLKNISGGFSELLDFDFQVESCPRNRALAQVIGSQEVVLVLHFQVAGDPLAGDIMVAIPHEVLASHLENVNQAGGGRKEDNVSYRSTILETVIPAMMDVSVELGEAQLPLRELMHLKRGDLLVLENRVGSPVIVPVEGVPKFSGVIGTRGKRFAVKLSKTINEKKSQGVLSHE